MGSLVLIEEDSNSAYSKIIERCFLSAGVEFCHQLFYGSANSIENSFKLYHTGDERNQEADPKLTQEKLNMKIAHQYQNQSASDMMARHSISQNSVNKNSVFLDLGNQMEVEKAEQRVCVKRVNDEEDILGFLETYYKDETPSMPNTRMLHKRVAFRTLISGVCSSFWEGDSLKFLAGLRKISPINSFTMVTIPGGLVSKRHRRYFDACIKVSSLTADLNHTTTDEYEHGSIRKMGYHGLIHVTKCNSALCLNPAKPPSNEMAFKFKKIGGLQIDTIHLPPEDTVQDERNQKLAQILKSSNKSVGDMF